jgi:exopolysaccharide biosynthesis polyprenyl glycosylphosphotransferase
MDAKTKDELLERADQHVLDAREAAARPVIDEHVVTREPAAARTRTLTWVGAPPRPTLRSEGVWPIARAASDAAAIAVASAATGMASDARLGSTWHTILIVVLLTGFAASGSYLSQLRLQLADELRRVVSATAVAFLGVGTAATLLHGDGFGAALIEYWLPVTAAICTGRALTFGIQRTARTRLGFGIPTLIVGAGRVGHLTAKRLRDEPQLGLRPIGFLDKEPLDEDTAVTLLGKPLPVLGASWDLERVVRSHRVEHVVIAFSTAPHHVLLGIVRRCQALGLSVSVVPRLYEVEGRRISVDHLGALPLVGLRSNDPRGLMFAIKYGLDRVIGTAFLLVVLPVLAAVALAVAITQGRPVLFRQERVGRDGRIFWMYKFRTMRGAPTDSGEADADWAASVLWTADIAGAAPETPVRSREHDRRTPLGAFLRKLSLDELPQLWNVVRGDMSLIGPRPERAHYVEQFEDVVYRYPDRHRVKSGLTGWAQVHGLRGETSLADRIEWDNFYIENWTPWLDLKIIAMTVPALFGRRRGS